MKIKIHRIFCYYKDTNSEYISCVYLNGKKYIYGDEYHNHINHKIDGIIGMLEFLNIEYKYTKKEIIVDKEEDLWDYDFPENI